MAVWKPAPAIDRGHFEDTRRRLRGIAALLAVLSLPAVLWLGAWAWKSITPRPREQEANRGQGIALSRLDKLDEAEKILRPIYLAQTEEGTRDPELDEALA